MENDPIDDIKRLHRQMDARFMELYVGSGLASGIPSRPGRPYLPATDVFCAEDLSKVVVVFELPGIDLDSIRVFIQGRDLTVVGVRCQPEFMPGGHYYHHMEIEYGSFRRVMSLPFDVDVLGCDLGYQDGILTMEFLRLPDGVPAPEQRTQVTLREVRRP